jgi:hypothetical protein
MKLARTSAVALVLGLSVAGCGGGGGRGSGAFAIAPSTSSSTSSTTSGTVATGSSGTAPGSSASVVSATVQTNAFAAFHEKASAADMVIPADPINKGKAFVAEDVTATVRVLDLTGAAPKLDRVIPLDATPLPQGCALGAMSISRDGKTACVTASGAGKEFVYVFDPAAAQTAADVTRFDFSAVTLDFAAAITNSAGASIGTTLQPSYLAQALVSSSGKLFIACSDIDKNFDYNPGVVLAFDFDVAKRTLSAGKVIPSSNWNPTRLTEWTGPSGEDAVLVTVSGISNKGSSSVDVIDATAARLVGAIPLGSGNGAGNVAIAPDGRRGYVGSMSASEVSIVDLTGLQNELANAQPLWLSQRYVDKIALPGMTGLNYISGLQVSGSGRYLYAVNFNESSLDIVDLTGATPAFAGRTTAFARSGNPARFEDSASLLGVRPGIPGIDFQGPPAYVVTINLTTADRTVPDVTISLDAVSFDQN